MKATLVEWLSYFDQLQLRRTSLSNDRLNPLVDRMKLKQPDAYVVTFAGTNGKGSTLRLVESILLKSGHSVASFTSPFLLDFTEQFQCDGLSIDAQLLVQYFNQIEQARQNIRLTYFDYKFLTFWLWLKDLSPEVILLEVGLGGRLDPVNQIDPDVSVITSIGIDHVEYLGPTRAHIALEKAGIFRKNGIAICGEKTPPKSLVDYAKQIKTRIYYRDQDFHRIEQDSGWIFVCDNVTYENLPNSRLCKDNTVTALMVLTCLSDRFSVKIERIKECLKQACVPGRLQWLCPKLLVDVSHNEDSVALLANHFIKNPVKGNLTAVFSAIAGRPFEKILQPMQALVSQWYVAPLQNHPNTLSVSELTNLLHKMPAPIASCDSISVSMEKSLQAAKEEDVVIVFGSFGVVKEAMLWWKHEGNMR